ncbi:MAG: hypothetical protein ACTIC2_07525 [Enterococcus devriesei]|uniref:hypothetical protein n=1 Tax=Enterococcus devriesei TaxID=319970 RepID=UPI003F8FB6CC
MGIVEFNKMNLDVDERDNLFIRGESAFFLNISERIQFEVKKTGKSFNELFYSYKGSINQRKRYDKTDEKELKWALKKTKSKKIKLTNKNAHLLLPSQISRLEDILDINFCSGNENALWMTSLLYEFYFIRMPKKESMFEYNYFGDALRKPKDIYKSYSNLKKAFQLLIAPLSLATFIEENNIKENNEFIDLCSNRMLTRILKSNEYLKKSRKSEGFENLTVEEQELNYDIKNSEKFYDHFTILSDLFVQLFSDEAKKIIDYNKYNFFKSSANDLSKDGIMKFFNKDFMPRVISSVEKLMSNDGESGTGFQIYSRANEAYLYFLKGDVNVADIKLRELDEYIKNRETSWGSWYSKIETGSQTYNKWCLVHTSDNAKQFDPMEPSILVEDIDDYIEDRRKN